MGENSAIINQGLFYLDWLVEHIAEFQLLVQKKLGHDVEVDTGSPRLILIATSYSKFDGMPSTVWLKTSKCGHTTNT